jgi:putative resolvase
MDVVSRRISLTAWGRLYGFDKATTARMHHAGKLPPELQVEHLPNGRYYVVVPPEQDGRCVVYARVSSGGQMEDLDRQVGRVVEWATQRGYRPDEVVKEIGSGLKGNRRWLRRVIADPTVKVIVVEHRERLCRFGFEYLEAALAGRGARIVVKDQGEVEDDLVRDVTEVMTSLCARLYGRRSAKRRAERALAAAREG